MYLKRQNVACFCRLIFADKSSKNLFLFLLLNLTMAFVELLYGIWTNRFAFIDQDLLRVKFLIST